LTLDCEDFSNGELYELPAVLRSKSSGSGLGRHTTVTGVLFSFAVIVAVVTIMVLTALERVSENANVLDDERSRETTVGALKTFDA
jgi:hypothetical protein